MTAPWSCAVHSLHDLTWQLGVVLGYGGSRDTVSLGAPTWQSQFVRKNQTPASLFRSRWARDRITQVTPSKSGCQDFHWPKSAQRSFTGLNQPRGGPVGSFEDPGPPVWAFGGDGTDSRIKEHGCGERMSSPNANLRIKGEFESNELSISFKDLVKEWPNNLKIRWTRK